MAMSFITSFTQRMRMPRKLPSIPVKTLAVSFIISTYFLVFYSTQLLISRNKLYVEIRQSPLARKCPIQEDAQGVCIHMQANYLDLVERCGKVTATFGDCQDRFYEAILTPIEAMEVVSNHTYKMIVEPREGAGEEVDAFVQRNSRWIISMFGAAGYEVLTTFDDKERVALQQYLDQLQNRCERFFRGAIDPYGFGSSWHNMGLALAITLHHNTTLFTPDTHNFFIPMTTCTEAQMDKAFAAHPPETDFQQWGPSTINYRSPGIDYETLMKNKTIILPEFEHKGHFWWRSMLTYYAVRPNAKMREMFRSRATFSLPCMSIHVRHSDKITEAPLIEFPKYMEKAEEYKSKSGISAIFLMTDDDKVIQSTKDYPGFHFYYYKDMPRTNKGWIWDTHDGIPRDQQEINFLMDIYSATRCQHSIVTYSSNVGRLIAEIMWAERNVEPDVVSMDSEWFMYP